MMTRRDLIKGWLVGAAGLLLPARALADLIMVINAPGAGGGGASCSAGISGTFGSNTGTSTYILAADEFAYQTFTAGETGYVNRITVWLQYASDNNFYAGLYNSSGELLQGSSETDPNDNAQAGYAASITQACIENGVDYILGCLLDDGGSLPRRVYASSSNTWYKFARSFTSGLPASFTPGDAAHGTRSGQDLRIYADYV